MRPFIRLDSAERRNQPFPVEVTVLALARPAWWIWVAIAGLSLFAAVAWRLTGQAPAIPRVLDGAGLVLWLSGYWLANHWNQLLARQHRHTSHAPERWSWWLVNAGHLLAVAILLALAPLSLLLAYDTNATIALIYVYDDLELHLPAGLWLAHSLVLLGPSLVLISVFLLHTLRRIFGWRWGLVLWLAATATAQASMLFGPTLSTLRTSLGTYSISLGGFATWAAQKTAQTQVDTPYLVDLVGALLKLPFLILPAAIALVVLAQWPLNHRQPAANPAWLAATLAVLVTAGRALWQGWQWVHDARLATPGDWRALLVLGIAVTWIVWALLALNNQRRLTTSPAATFGWCWLSAAAWVGLTSAHRLAASAEPASLIIGGIVAALIASAGALLIERLGWLYREPGRQWTGGIVILFLAVLLVPLGLTGANQSVLWFLFSTLQAELLAGPLWQATLILLAATGLLITAVWLTTGRKHRRPAVNSHKG